MNLNCIFKKSAHEEGYIVDQLLMKKSTSIYLQSDREAAENLKSLSQMLKLLLDHLKSERGLESLNLNRIFPVLQNVIKKRGVRNDVLNLTKSLRDLLLGQNPDKKEAERLTLTLLDKAEQDLNYKAARYIKKEKDDMGMTERYLHLTVVDTAISLQYKARPI